MKNEIICPHCQKAFKIDDTAFADILKQVRDREFNNEINSRLEQAVKMAILETESKSKEVKALKEAEIARLQSEKDNLKSILESEKKLAVSEAISKFELENSKLHSLLDSKDNEQKLKENSLKQNYQQQIKDRDETIERLKELKAKLSVKLVGETLEQHCENEFNSVRATAFANAYFEKDNEISDGTKGDFIYRDFDKPGGT